MTLKSLAGVVLAVTLTGVISSPAYADRGFHRGWGGGWHQTGFVHWHDGRWIHDWHGGRFGWWWLAGGSWYFYTAPIYPYPEPYYTQQVIVDQPPVVVAAPQQQTWYYCAEAKAYYPYVSSCRNGWQAVPAQPQGTPQQ